MNFNYFSLVSDIGIFFIFLRLRIAVFLLEALKLIRSKIENLEDVVRNIGDIRKDYNLIYIYIFDILIFD